MMAVLYANDEAHINSILSLEEKVKFFLMQSIQERQLKYNV